MTFIATITEKRKAKLRERALYESEVVTAVRRHLDDKIAGFDDTNAELIKKLEEREREFLAKRKSGESERMLIRMLEACDRVKAQIMHNNNKTDDFLKVCYVILDLEMYVESLIDYEWYGFLIHTIPEIRLPSMINNARDIEKIVNTVQAIIDKIDKKMLRTFKTLEEYQSEKKKIEKRAAIMKARYSNTTDLNARISEIERKYSEENSEFTMPAAAPATADIKIGNENKA